MRPQPNAANKNKDKPKIGEIAELIGKNVHIKLIINAELLNAAVTLRSRSI